MFSILDFSCYFNWTFFYTSLVLNGVIFFMLAACCSEAVKTYRRILTIGVILDLLAVVLIGFSQPFFARSGTELFIYSHYLHSWPGKFKCMGPMIMAMAINMSYYTMSIQAIYRYYQIVKSTSLSIGVSLRIYSIVFFVSLGFTLWNFLDYKLVENQPAAIQQLLLDNPIIGNIPNVTRGACTMPISSMSFAGYLSSNVLILILNAVIIAWTNKGAACYLRSLRNVMSSATKQAHIRIGKKLLLQNIGPFLIVLNLIIIVLITCKSQKRMGDGSMIIACVIFMAHYTLNPIITIYCVKCFRERFARRVRQLFNLLLCRKDIDSPTSKISGSNLSDQQTPQISQKTEEEIMERSRSYKLPPLVFPQNVQSLDPEQLP